MVKSAKMVKQAFYFPYCGSKKGENLLIEPLVDQAGEFDKVVEVFGGSLAFSRWMYGVHGDGLEYLCSDMDANLVSFCNAFPRNKKEVMSAAIGKQNEIATSMNPKSAFKEYFDSGSQLVGQDKTVWELLFRKNSKNAKMGYFDPKRKMCAYRGYLKQTAQADAFFLGREYKVQDFRVYLEQVKDDPKAFVYLDPPYLMDPIVKGGKRKNINAHYAGFGTMKAAEKQLGIIYSYLLEWMKECKCKYVLVHSDHPRLREWCSMEQSIKLGAQYPKYYSMSKKWVQHIVLTNI
jgi:site-specific DNA-adenine methylase